MNATLSVLGLSATLAFAPLARGQTNIQMNIGLPGKPAPVPFVHDTSASILKSTIERIDDKAERYFFRATARGIFDSELHPEDNAERHGTKLVSQAARHALRLHWKETPLRNLLSETGERAKQRFFGTLQRTGGFLSKEPKQAGELTEAEKGRRLTNALERAMLDGTRLEFTQDFDHDFVREDPYIELRMTIEERWQRHLRYVLRLSLEEWHEPLAMTALSIPFHGWSLSAGAEYRFVTDRDYEEERHGRLFTRTDRAFEPYVSVGRRVGDGLFSLKYSPLDGLAFAMLSFGF